MTPRVPTLLLLIMALTIAAIVLSSCGKYDLNPTTTVLKYIMKGKR
tara:strand:+ start:372 stop:509 length:138 start_codon:yes stop_codon:yes gene_type:complete